MSVPNSQDDLASLQRQLTEARENLRLIEARKAEYVLGVDVPLQLVKEEQRLQQRIAELEQTLDDETPPPVTPPGGPETGKVSPVRPDQRWQLIILYLVGLIGMAVITLLFFDRLRCLVEYRISPGVVALISLLASGIAVVVSLLVNPPLRHKLWSVYGGIATALIGGIIVALLLPPLSREFCSFAASTPNLGDTRIRPADGMPQMYVPAGTFQMGSTTGNADEQPVHEVTLDAFWFDRTEVTNAQYARCVADGKCATPPQSRSATRDSYYGNPDFSEYPVLYVSWDEALMYCSWAGGQLPTEAQWEYAARGPQSFIYPWGNAEPNTDRLNYDQNVGDTMPVGSYLPGVSWIGALDMSGNVYEWVSDWYEEPYPAVAQRNPAGPTQGDKRIMRGGGWHSPVERSRASFRNHVSADYRDNVLGFRCVSNTVTPATSVVPIPENYSVAGTPTPAATTPALAIISPSAGNRVSYKTHVHGRLSNLPADRQLWLLVQSYFSPDYFPQSGPVSINADGSWESIVWIGANAPAETGRAFTLTLALADATAGQTFSDFINTRSASTSRGLAQLPAGAQVLQTVQVERTNPVITVSSHHAGNRVQGYEVLKGTYSDLEPGDWQLYAIVSAESGRFTPFGPFEPTRRTGEWQVPVYFPWPAPDEHVVSFWMWPVLTGTDAAQRLEKAVGKTLTSDDLPPQTWGLYEQQARTEVERHERVAFASDRAGNDDVFIINADGTGLQRLTDDPGIDSMPAWSPDGQQIAYVSRADDQYRLIIRTVNDVLSYTVPITVGNPQMPAWSPDGQWLAFQTWQGDNIDLYKVRLDGSELTRLTQDTGRNENPVWSPDGQHLLFLFRPIEADNSQSELYLMEADGGNVTRLTNDEFAEGYAAWSPDGQRIIFVHDDGENRDVYQMKADGSGIVRLPSADYDGHPTFAPDGQRYVFHSSVNRVQVFIGTSAGGEPTMIMTGLTISAEPAWSPKDDRIAFAGRFNGDWDIYSMWDDGADIRSLTSPITDTTHNEIEPRLSPDGHWLAFESDIDGDYEIWLEDAYSLSEWQRLTDNTAQDWHPSWSPDGNKIVFTSNRGGNLDIYVMNADGTGVNQLTADPAHDDDPIWTSDGQHIIFYSDRSGDGDLYEMNAADGSHVTPLVQEPGYDGQPAISPDDQVLIFASARDNPGSYATELYRLDLLSGTLTRLTGNEDYDSIPLWSTSGEWLYFASDRYDGIDDVWRMLPDGGDQRNLTQDHWSDTPGP